MTVSFNSEIHYTQTVTHWLNHLCRCENLRRFATTFSNIFEMKLWLEIGLELLSCLLKNCVYLRTVKSSGNKPEQSYAFMTYAIGLIKTSRHAFSSMVGSGSRSQDLLGDDIIILL